MTLKHGFYWAKYNGWWELVEIVEYDHRSFEPILEAKGPYCLPYEWQKVEKKNYVWNFGDEHPTDIGVYSEFVPANLVDPDGNPYYNSGDNYEGN
jgi:hypothetical protein